MKNLLKYLMFILLLSFTACNDDEDINSDSDPDLTEEEDLSTIESDFNTVDNMVSAAMSEGSSSGRIAYCGTVTFLQDTTSSVPGFGTDYRKFTLTFAAGSSCENINTEGTITVFVTGRRTLATYKDSVVYNQSFKIAGRTISGYRVLKSIPDQSSSSLWVFSSKSLVEYNLENGKTATWTADRIRKHYNPGNATTSYFEITGSGTGSNRFGKGYTMQIENPLVITSSCGYRYPVEGTIVYQSGSRSVTRVIDYGDGDCDRIATYTNPRGRDFTFEMR